MNLTLRRTSFTADGIFGAIWTDEGTLVCHTLEHAYPSSLPPLYQPKVPPGSYTCQRGTHQLEHGGPFEAFEICGVPGHTGVLFHIGNTNCDSSGCVLLGCDVAGVALLKSGDAFSAFMGLLKDFQTFTLNVKVA